MKLGATAFTLVVLFPTGLYAAEPSDMKVENLRCEYLRQEEDCAVFAVESGTYRFQVKR